jgi:hypothetical protein
MRWFDIVTAIVAVYGAGLSTFNYLARRGLDFQKWGSVPQALATLMGVVALVIGWSVTYEQSVKRDIMIEQREKASAIAEYAALAMTLKDKDDEQTYRRANQLSWQLFLWLPDNVYRDLGGGLANADYKKLVESLLAVRKSLLGKDAGTLGADDIIVHGPGIGAVKPRK